MKLSCEKLAKPENRNNKTRQAMKSDNFNTSVLSMCPHEVPQEKQMLLLFKKTVVQCTFSPAMSYNNTELNCSDMRNRANQNVRKLEVSVVQKAAAPWENSPLSSHCFPSNVHLHRCFPVGILAFLSHLHSVMAQITSFGSLYTSLTRCFLDQISGLWTALYIKSDFQIAANS